MSANWTTAPDPRLSQGDIVEPIVVASPTFPDPYLKRRTFGQGKIGWESADQWHSSDKENIGFVLARGAYTRIVILSHSCDLDKNERKARVIIAPVAPASRIQSEQDREAVFSRRRLSLCPLPGIPDIGDMYADLRLITHVDRKFLDGASRLASMSDVGRQYLARHVAGFFIRDLPLIEE